jgi:hypothetical protein
MVSASDPYTLIFEDLPERLEVDLYGKDGVKTFTARFEDVIRDLEHVYPRLLDRIGSTLEVTFGHSGNEGDFANQLRIRAKRLLSVGVDRRLTTFIREASRETTDWREGLGRAVMDGVPPSHWKDADIIVYETRIQQLVATFLQLEELQTLQQRDYNASVIRIELLDDSYAQVRTVMSVPSTLEPIVASIEVQLRKAMSDLNHDAQYPKLRLAALARVLARESAELREETTS